MLSLILTAILEGRNSCCAFTERETGRELKQVGEEYRVPKVQSSDLNLSLLAPKPRFLPSNFLTPSD